jgi:putative oxidoreductase
VSSYDDRTASSATTSGARPNEYTDRGDENANSYADTAELNREQTTEVPPAKPWRLGWNSGADLGLLIIRAAVGGIFAAHGAQKVFGWWGGPGLDTFATNLTGMGFRQADVLSAATAFAELVGGVLVVLGLFTPLAAAALLSVAINAVWVRWGGGLFLVNGGYEFELALAAMAAGLTLTGPGRVALDYGRSWFRHPVIFGLLCLMIGVAVAVAVRLVWHG